MRTSLFLALACAAVPVAAEPPAIVTDILPVHALVSAVTQGITSPQLLVSPNVDAHNASLKPSQARALDQADMIIWIGPEYAPWLAKSVETLGGDAQDLRLLSVEGTQLYSFRESAVFSAHDTHDDHGEDDAHGHDEDHAESDAHGHDDDHDHHDHDGVDPHAWLDPQNAQIWLADIARQLADLDPENADRYKANAARAVASIDAVIQDVTRQLAGTHERPYLVFHDAYQYFERAFDLNPTGALSLGDASTPSAGHLSTLQALMRDEGIVCVFAEPQYSKRLITRLVEGTDAKTGILDPLGRDIPEGADFYPSLLRALADNLADCLSG